MLNQVAIMGRIGSDLNLTQTQSGVSVLSFRVAVDRDFKDKQTGERETDWINCVAWRGKAEFIANHFSKGRMIVLAGRLQTRDYTDKDGNKRYVTEILVSDVYFADSKRDTENGGGLEGNTNENDLPPVKEQGFSEIPEEDESDLPF